MKVFLTSSPGGSYIENGQRFECELDPRNNFVTMLKGDWKEDSTCLIISSDPDNVEMNDSIKTIIPQSFSLSGLPFLSCEICDSRSPDKNVDNYDVIILSGGHVPTQNLFFHKLRLKEKLRSFQGIIIGISAGSMNSAETVYAHPELPGEAADPSYERFLSGLGLTDTMILPHYYDLLNEVLDGRHAIKDIACEDSIGKAFYALPDGSYIMISDQKTCLYGEAFLIKDGEILRICEENHSIEL